MNSYCIAEFWEQYNDLPVRVRTLADGAYQRWLDNPSHPGLFFKHVKGTKDWWSVRIGSDYRALCVRDGEECSWFFIGNHQDYEKLVP